MTSPSTILIATTNHHKADEVRAILADLPARFVTLDDFPTMPEAVEDADTFEGNARIKALYYAAHAGCWTLADDSGLEVDVLGGAPGVHSARFAGSACDTAANNAKLVAQLARTPATDRSARFRCAVALAGNGEILAEAAGTVDGMIVDEPAGDNGFGYDPHFYVPTLAMTTAQMTPEQKNQISHRGRAVRSIRIAIERLLSAHEA